MAKRKLDDEQVDAVRHLYRHTAMNLSDLARMFRVSQGVIQHVVDRKGAYSQGRKQVRV
jgi:hypothetical protein